MKYFYYIFYPLRVIIYIACLLPCLIWAQEKDTLKVITPGDYSKWYQLSNNPGFSKNGNWLGYTLYNEEKDTLIVQQIYGQKKYAICKSRGFEFLGDSLVFFNQNERNYLMFLNSGRRKAFSPDTDFKITNNEHYIMIFYKSSEKLVLRSLRDNDSLLIMGVSAYSYSPVFEGVCAISSCKGIDNIHIVRLKNGFSEKSIPIPQNRQVLEFKWHLSGNYLAFTMGPDRNAQDTTDVGLVGYYDINREKASYLNPAKTDEFPRGHVLISHWNYPLEFTPDGKQVFFAHRPETIILDEEIPEIWKSDDPYVYEKMKYLAGWRNTPKISIWNQLKDKYQCLTDQNFPEAFYGLDEDYALVYNPDQYRLYHKLNSTFDVYLMNLTSGDRKLLITDFINSVRSLQISPSGRYILYLKGGQWWCYDTRKDQLYNLSGKLEMLSGINTGEELLRSAPQGWTRDESGVYMHDPYDLWKISTGNTPSERITRGRENEICFKLIDNIPRTQSDLRNNRGIYLDEQIWYFEVRKGDKMGYAIKKADGNIEYISLDECYTKWPKITSNNKLLNFLLENYDTPPRLKVYDVDSDTLFQVFQSNPHYKDYLWYKEQRINYHNKDGKRLVGILNYPLNFKKDSLYPMVVHVYEKQSQYWNQYINPSFYNASGFNSSNLVAEGYFVFLPDIEYKTGEPGFSAADCIISGTKAAMENAPVNPAKIGLTGYSFGGYETMFTIAQTDLFATAIAGSGVSNLPGDYLSLQDQSSFEFYMYESFQLRMGKMLFDDYQGYLDNSPVYHAENVHIPFLLFTGGKDYHVNYTQTMAFHFAMKRLGKQNTMLIYPNEAHAFIYPENKRDLTLKVHQWFEHYLKEGVKQAWMP